MSKQIERIPLTELQKSYCNGASLSCGMVTKSYFLYDFKSQSFDISLFTEAVNKLAAAHMMLRCVGVEQDVQRISMKVEPVITVVKCNSMDLQVIQAMAEPLFESAFEADDGALFQFVVFQEDKERVKIMLLTKGIIADGFSYGVLIRDLERLYSGGRIEPCDVFRQYVSFLTDRIGTEEYLESKDYWLKQVETLPEAPKLPLLSSPTAVEHANTFMVYRFIPRSIINQVTEIAADAGVTLFSLLLTLFSKTIALYSEQGRFVLNLPYSVRPPEIDGIGDAVGLFSDFLLFDFEDTNCSIGEQARTMQMKLIELQDYSDISACEILRLVQRVTGRPLQAPVVFTSTLGLSGAEGELFETSLVRTQTSQVWLESMLTECGDNILFSMTCMEELIDRRIANGLADTFFESVLRAVEQGQAFLDETSFPLCKKELATITALNRTEVSDHLPCLAEQLEWVFHSYPYNMAIGCNGFSLTYAELYDRVCVLLNVLKNKYNLISGQDRIGILLQKGYEQIICAIAAVCGNYAYMPIDPELPAVSICDCMKKADLTLLITTPEFIYELKRAGINEYYDFYQTDFAKEGCNPVFSPAEPNDISIIINTSGTTGAPKSICLYQQSIVNCLIHTKNIFHFSSADRVLSVTNFSHDMAIFDTIGLLLCGGGVVIPDADKQKEPSHWNQLMKEYQITVWNSVPAFMEMGLASGELTADTTKILKTILLGGDWIRPTLADSIMKGFDNATLYSVGGPTETTIWNIYHKVSMHDIENQTIPYGRPFPNTSYFILNNRLQLCPPGVLGTMYVGGISVAAEYAGQPEETRKRFIQWNGVRIYNTGDLGVYLPDGTLLIKGRNDDQVKINGKRIELSGIEQVLNRFPGVVNSAAVVNNHTHKLTVYYTASTEFSNELLPKYMQKFLPSYMIPAVITWLREMPLARNGKVDRKVLANQKLTDGRAEEILDDRMVSGLLKICRELLSDESISPDLNFYMMGGDSVTAFSLISKIEQNYGVRLSIGEILEQPELAQWAGIIREKMNTGKNDSDNQGKLVEQICQEVFGTQKGDMSCLLDYESIIEKAEQISKQLSAITERPISKYDVICYPFVADWVIWAKEKKGQNR